MGQLSVADVKLKQKTKNDEISKRSKSGSDKSKKSGIIHYFQTGVKGYTIAGITPDQLKAYQTKELADAYSREFESMKKVYGHTPSSSIDYTKITSASDVEKMKDMLQYYNDPNIAGEFNTSAYTKLYPKKAIYHPNKEMTR